ncbi:MAG: lipoprotein signal peptidase [Rikenellaceae bacterium]
MKLRNISILVGVLLLLDQVLKIWIKTTMRIGESISVFGDWFQLRFVENNGAAFGMQISSGGGVDWGKMALSGFRACMICALGYYICYLIKRKAPKGVIIAMAAIFAGAVGNMIDSAIYGLIFSESTPYSVAQFGGEGYAAFMMGCVVDMFYFPLFQWNGVPKFLSFLVDSNNYFFGAIFNLADSYISVAVVYLLLFERKFFNE